MPAKVYPIWKLTLTNNFARPGELSSKINNTIK